MLFFAMINNYWIPFNYWIWQVPEYFCKTIMTEKKIKIRSNLSMIIIVLYENDVNEIIITNIFDFDYWSLIIDLCFVDIQKTKIIHPHLYKLFQFKNKQTSRIQDKWMKFEQVKKKIIKTNFQTKNPNPTYSEQKKQ